MSRDLYTYLLSLFFVVWGEAHLPVLLNYSWLLLGESVLALLWGPRSVRDPIELPESKARTQPAELSPEVNWCNVKAVNLHSW